MTCDLVHDFPTQNNDVKELEAPLGEMSFATIDEARKYYEDYGQKNGFLIRIRSSTKGRKRRNEVTSVLFVCAKEGKHSGQTNNEEKDRREEDDEVQSNKRNRTCSTFRCECKAQLRIKYDKWSSKWKVTVFNNTHNHQLVTPSKRMKMRSNSHIPKVEGLLHDDGNEAAVALRFRHLCQVARKVACLAAKSEEGYRIFMEAMNDLSKKLEKICGSRAPSINEKYDLDSTKSSQLLLSEPNTSETKGTKKDVKGGNVDANSGSLKSSNGVSLKKKESVMDAKDFDITGGLACKYDV